jgi:uncharacterized membrane protein YbaN (DUF454 family)
MVLLWRAVGFTALALAIVGAVLPLVPTTPFLLLAAWAFARSSERFHRWLLEHPRFGRPIADWQHHGVIPPVGKVSALLGMGGSVVVVVVLGLPLWVVLVHVALVSAVAAFILSRPSRRPFPGEGLRG